VTQVDSLSPYAAPAAKQWARMVGSRVAETFKVLLSMEPGGGPCLAAQARILRSGAACRIPRVCAPGDRAPRFEGSRPHCMDLRQGNPTAGCFLKRELYTEAEVQAVQVGPAVFISNPAKFFCQFGLNLKRPPFPGHLSCRTGECCVGQ